MPSMVRRHMWCSSIAPGSLCGVMHRSRAVVWLMGMPVLRGVGLRRHVMASRIRASPVVVVTVAVVATGRLGSVGDHLHPSGDSSGGTAATSRIGGGCGAAKTLIELLEERATDVVGCNVDGISHAHHD